MKHIICATVENKIGVLAHIAGLFAARGYNINSLAVAETESRDLSRMTIVADDEGNEAIIEQIRKQLEKVVSVVKVNDLTREDHIERDLALIRVNVPAGRRGEIIELVDIFRGKIADVGAKDMVVEVTGAEDKIEAIADLLRPYGIKELVRTGRIAMTRGARSK
ncbi:MAG: acetolactate synthase small subunit [Planctomycetes bacterium]|nr:acetolactate synthase small subunit [Planctomycetota bacterium]